MVRIMRSTLTLTSFVGIVRPVADMTDCLSRWLDSLGYAREAGALHLVGRDILSTHPYAVELRELLRPDGLIRAQAVFDVHGTPTVVFFEDDGSLLTDSRQFDGLRQRIWNQNLISVVMVADRSHITAMPLGKKFTTGEAIDFQAARQFGRLSAADFWSNEIQQRHTDWFKPESRVDQELLANLRASIKNLIDESHLSIELSRLLMGQVLFISYLEHRKIISDMYRARRQVGDLHTLVADRDGKRIQKLIDRVRDDFNGDFLSSEEGRSVAWNKLPSSALETVDEFLKRTHVETGQRSLWNYDFSFIPVEMLSGIYESFIGDKQAKLGAYYTPRHLANLVVDQIFASSADPLEEVIFDGACGSGILLTTAFRRLIGYAEWREKRQLGFVDRIALLRKCIFGGDVSEAACRVTAFSLYLCLLERLEPSDILALQENEKVKLPPLDGENLASGERYGDFFGDANPLAGSRKFSVILSNPPWREPKRDETTSADTWAATADVARCRRQMAADYAQRALDCLKDEENSRLCLIMPASLFLAPSSRDYLQDWLFRVRIDTLINFGDLFDFIFKTSEHSCAVVIARPRRADGDEVEIPVDETFQYWAPKADTSIAFGRLTLSSADRFDVQTQAYFRDPTRLVALMWGNEADLALWGRLRIHGVFGGMVRKPNPRWISRKGVHLEDNSVDDPVSAEPLWDIPTVPIEALKRGLPVVRLDDLQDFDRSIETVPRLSEELLSVFDGPRVLFPDGFDNEREIRAAYIDVPASFASGIGTIAGPKADADLLRFAAVYLRSDLVKYFLVMRAYQVLCDRNRVTLTDIEEFPFVPPEHHPNPQAARAILGQIGKLTAPLAKPQLLRAENEYAAVSGILNDLVFDYFGLSPAERALVREAVDELLPSARPRGYATLHTQIQKRADVTQMRAYAATLQAELNDWKSKLHGTGTISVRVTAMADSHIGPFGAVCIGISDGTAPTTVPEVVASDAAIGEAMRVLHSHGLLPVSLGEQVFFAPDTLIWLDDTLYLIKPMIRRYWLQRAAIRDARQIVSGTHRKAQ